MFSKIMLELPSTTGSKEFECKALAQISVKTDILLQVGLNILILRNFIWINNTAR